MLNAHLFLKPKLLLHTEHSNNGSHSKKCGSPQAISAVCGSAPFWRTNLVIFGMTLPIIIWTLMPKFQAPIPVAPDRHTDIETETLFYVCMCVFFTGCNHTVHGLCHEHWHLHCWHSQVPCDGSWTAKIIKQTWQLNTYECTNCCLYCLSSKGSVIYEFGLWTKKVGEPLLWRLDIALPSAITLLCKLL